MRILLLASVLVLCSCALAPGHNNGGFFAGQAASQGATDAANAASQAGQAASQPMFMPSAGGF